MRERTESRWVNLAWCQPFIAFRQGCITMVIRIPKVSIFFLICNTVCPYLPVFRRRGWFLPFFLKKQGGTTLLMPIHFTLPPLAMTTNNRYLPLFFLCWALLYGPLVLLGMGYVGGSGAEKVMAPKPYSKQVLPGAGGERAVKNNAGCFWSGYDPVPGIGGCGQNHFVPFCLMDIPPGYGTR